MTSTWSAQLVAHGGQIVAVLDGEIDMASSSGVFAVLAAMDGDDGPLVVDLSAVTFIDSAGLRELVRLANQGPVRMVAAPGSIPERVLALTGLLDALPCFPSVDAATADN